MANRSQSLLLCLLLIGALASSAAEERQEPFGIQLPLASELLPNGNFEQGDAVWTQSSTNGLTLIRKLSEINTTPRSGSWGAVLGIANRELAYIEQMVAVPVTATKVGYWYQLGSLDTHLGFDFARIIVNGWDIIDEFQLYADENVTSWTLRSADISAYAGQIVTLRIAVENDVAEASTLVIDDVHLTLPDAAPVRIVRL